MNETGDSPTARPGPEWPAPVPGQVEVLLVGSYHMDGGVDELDHDVDDVLTPDRQRELETLCETLAEWGPDLVAVERPPARTDRVNELYEEYRTGDRVYDEEYDIDPPHPARSQPTTECRSEVVQIGFRLADRLGHDEVAPVDYTSYAMRDREFDDEELGAYEEANQKLDEGAYPRKTDVIGEADREDEDWSERPETWTIPERLASHNRRTWVDSQEERFFRTVFRITEDDHLMGPRAVASWYDRNIRMCHFLWREMSEATDRICLVVGSGHVHGLRQLLTDAPMFCPVSALPHLHEAAARLD